MSFKTVACALAAIIALPALALADEASQERKLRGAELYGESCARCHGPGARGDGPEAAETRVPALDLTLIAARREGVFPKAEVTEIIDGRRHVRAHGPSGMPVWGKEFLPDVSGGGPAEVVVRDRIQLLVEHLAALQRELSSDDGGD
jgi:mono/diheme cytochrome c family protein